MLRTFTDTRRLRALVAGALLVALTAALAACGGETVTVVETVIVEKEVPGAVTVETVIVDKEVPGAVTVETVIVEKEVPGAVTIKEVQVTVVII